MLAFERVDDVLELGRKGVHIGELGLDDFRVVQPPTESPRPDRELNERVAFSK